MPDVTGKSFEEAQKVLTDLGFTVVTKNEVENDAAVGEVVGQSVVKDEKVTVTTEIVLEVSKGPKMATVPNVVGRTFADAEAELNSWGFKMVTRVEVENNAAAGLVVSQSVPSQTQAAVNTEIILEVSKGPAAPVTTNKTVTVDLSAVYTEPVDPYKFELRQEGEVVFVMENCTQVSFEITLEGYSIQYYDIYLDDIYYDSLRVDFNAE